MSHRRILSLVLLACGLCLAAGSIISPPPADASEQDRQEAAERCCDCLAEAAVETAEGATSCIGTTTTTSRPECIEILVQRPDTSLQVTSGDCFSKCELSCAAAFSSPDGGSSPRCPNPDEVQLRFPDGGVVCRPVCDPAAPIPRCEGWQACLQLSLADGGPAPTGACIAAGAPSEPCNPEPCAEVLVCARLSERDGGTTCRITCAPSQEGADCPGEETCFSMGDDAGACFPP